MSPCGINRGQRFALGVLHGIKQHASGWALADAALERRVSRQLGSNELADDFREGASLRVTVNRCEGHEDVKSGGPGGLEEADQVRGEQRLVNRARHAKHSAEGRLRRGVEIEEDVVGIILMVESAGPRIVVDATEIGKEEKGSAVFGHYVVHFSAALVGIYRRPLDPGRNRFRRFLLEEALFFDSIWIAPHDERPVLEEGKNMVRRLVVVREKVALADVGLRKINFVQVREGECPTVDLQAQALRRAVRQFLKTCIARGSFGSRRLGCRGFRILRTLRPRGGKGAFYGSPVSTDAKKNGRAQVSVVGPVRVFDSSHHRGPHPRNLFAQLGRIVQRRTRNAQFLELREQILLRALIEPSAGAADKLQILFY